MLNSALSEFFPGFFCNLIAISLSKLSFSSSYFLYAHRNSEKKKTHKQKEHNFRNQGITSLSEVCEGIPYNNRSDDESPSPILSYL